MIKTQAFAALVAAIWMVAAAPQARADDGHGHGDAPASPSGPVLPRFAAVSEAFELVGVLDGKRLTLYLDHYADGSPVKEARLELELGGIKVAVESHGEGEFEALLEEAPHPGEHEVSATVITGDGTEPNLLVGELDIHDDEGEASKSGHIHGWREYAFWIIGAAALLIPLLFLIRRRRTVRRADRRHCA